MGCFTSALWERNAWLFWLELTRLRMSDFYDWRLGKYVAKIVWSWNKTGKLVVFKPQNGISPLYAVSGANEPLFCSGRAALTVNGVYRVFQTAGEYLERMILVRTRARHLAIIIIKRLVTLPDWWWFSIIRASRWQNAILALERDNLERQLWTLN